MKAIHKYLFTNPISLAVITCVGLLLIGMSGVLSGLLAPVADFLGWLTRQVPVSPEHAPLATLTFVLLVFRLSFLPFAIVYAKVNRATGQLQPEIIQKSPGNHPAGEWLAEYGTYRDFYLSNTAYRRYVLLLLLYATIFLVVLLAAAGHTIIGWDPATEFSLNNSYLWIYADALIALTLCIPIGVLVLGSAKLISILLPDTNRLKRNASIDFVSGHMNATAMIPLYIAESVVFFGVMLVTQLAISDFPYPDYFAEAYALAMLIYVPIWSAVSTVMDWRNERLSEYNNRAARARR